MRALLVCNPKATTTNDRIRDVLAGALRSVTDLEIAYTRRRGHGASLARNARKNGVDVVVALGGDGTVNEVVNGLLADGTGPDVPALAVLAGGSTNVFVRALGLPVEWAEGTAVILEALRAGRTRSIGLGRATGVGGPILTRRVGADAPLDRYFTFCAGFGLDADVISRVERARSHGRRNTPLLYMQAMAGNFVLDRGSRAPRITIEGPGIDEPSMLSMVVIQNTAPWTYVGRRPIDANPSASFDLGLDVMAMRGMPMTSTSRTMAQLYFPRRSRETGRPAGPHGKQVLTLSDLSEFTLRAKLPTGFQVDGDYLGERDEVRFTSVTQALRVVC